MFLEDGYLNTTKTDPFSLESLIAWLEKQPEDKTYEFHDCQGFCLIAQYVKTISTGEMWGYSYNRIPSRIRHDVAMEKPWTYGAALERARDLMRRAG